MTVACCQSGNASEVASTHGPGNPDPALRSGHHPHPHRRRSARACPRRAGGDRRSALHRPAGNLAALLHPRQRAEQRAVRGRHRLRWLLHPRLPAHPRVGHAAPAGSRHGLRGSSPRHPDPVADLRHRRSAHAPALHPRPALRRQEGGGVPADNRDRDRVLLGPGDRVLPVQLSALRPERALGLLLHRLRGGDLELGLQRRREPGSPAAPQGGLLPGSAGRPTAGAALRDRAADDRGGDRRGGAPPRGGHRRSDGDRHPLRRPGRDRGQGPQVQVHRQERGLRQRLRGDLHAQADVCDNGSGMHTHQSLWSDGRNLFYDADGYALLSDAARHYIGGLLAHAPAVLAFAAPTTNSYRRLVPGYEAPINLVYSARNRSACIRIPTYFSKPSARRLEFRSPDPSCNPYLSFAAQLMAGLDGIINAIEPPRQSTRTSTSSKVRSALPFATCPARSRRRSTLWRRTRTSCTVATSSRATWSRHGSISSEDRRRRSRSVPTRTSSSCIRTSEPLS